MSSNSLKRPVSALHEILDWSRQRPDWQRDALRRIVTNGAIEISDQSELERLCRAPHDVDIASAPALRPQPLSESHLPPGPGSEAAVTLVSIGNLQQVNRLPSDQTLAFGPSPGLSVVFGDNGSGKSGFARVIKKACRTRGSPPMIHPNAFGPTAPGPASGWSIHLWRQQRSRDRRLGERIYACCRACEYLRVRRRDSEELFRGRRSRDIHPAWPRHLAKAVQGVRCDSRFIRARDRSNPRRYCRHHQKLEMHRHDAGRQVA